MQKLIRNLRLYAPYAISCVFALFGLVNPQSKFDVLQIFLFTFLISHLLYSQQKRNRAFLTIWTLTLFAALFSYLVYLSENLTLASLFAFAGVIYFFILKRTLKNLNKIFVAHLVVFFLISAYFNSTDLRKMIAFEPAPKTYFNDYLGFLRNFYLVEKEYGYYEGLVITLQKTEDPQLFRKKFGIGACPHMLTFGKYFPVAGEFLSIFSFWLFRQQHFILLTELGEFF